MDSNSSEYPSRVSDVFYGLDKQKPSYQSEFPQDLPYDPGATSGLFELNYFPTTGSYLLLIVPIFIALFFVFFRKKITRDFSSYILFIALSLTILGPLRFPSFFPFRTVLGLVKAMGYVLLLYRLLLSLRDKSTFILSKSVSFIPISMYVLSMMSSLLVMTNLTFFVQDFGIAITGLIFYYLGFTLFDWKTGKRQVLMWGGLLILPSALVIYIFLSRAAGKELMSLLYQPYENFVFLHDLDRNRIFSVIDFEYFVPCLALFIVAVKRKASSMDVVPFYIIGAMSFVAILLVDYRYRVMTYLLGFVWSIMFTKKFGSTIKRATVSILIAISMLYFSLSFIFNRSTIIDRFLLKNYSEDQVSVERRIVMYKQAWELFLQSPLLGVGTGNYKDNVQIVYSRFGGRSYEPYYKILQNVYAYPHNWFLTVLAENGIVGIAILFYMLWSFLVMDWKLYKALKDEKLLIHSALSGISWLYVFANQFTMMHVSLPIVIIFWACRGMIERIYSEHFKLV